MDKFYTGQIPLNWKMLFSLSRSQDPKIGTLVVSIGHTWGFSSWIKCIPCLALNSIVIKLNNGEKVLQQQVHQDRHRGLGLPL